MKILNIKLFYNKLFITFCVLTLTFFSGHTFQTVFPMSKYILIIMGYLFIFPIVYAYFNNKLDIYMGSLISFLIMIVLTVIFHLGGGLNYYIFLICRIIFAFGMVLMYDFEDFINIFLKVMVIISIISLVGHILLQNTNLLNNLPLLINGNGVTYRSAVIFNYITIIPQRNSGMFWEPGIFATFLIYSIIFEIYFKEGAVSIKRIILFSLCIFTTKSSAGYLLWIISLVLLITSKDKSKIKSKMGISKYVHILLFVGFILIIVNLDYIILNTSLANNQYVTKLLSDNIKDSSRINAVWHNLKIFSKNPAFGSGILGVNSQMSNVADTSTSTHFMSIFGILGSLYTIYFIYGVFKCKSKDILSKICVVIILLFIINKEPHGGIIFTWCLLFYLLKDKPGKGSTCE